MKSFKCIELNKRGTKFKVDAKDYDLLMRLHDTFSMLGEYPAMRVSKRGTFNGYDMRWHTEVAVHRFLMKASGDDRVDHINGDKMDARRANLRLCTHSQNLMNRGMNRNNTSGYKGVKHYQRAEGEKFSVHISKDRKRYNFGSYNDAEVAARVYDRECVKLHGEFAHLNFPDENNKKYKTPKGSICKVKSAKSGHKYVYPDGKNTYYVQVRYRGKVSTIANKIKTVKEAVAIRDRFMKGRVTLSQ